MDIQKINWKIYIENPDKTRPDDFFKVFNSWIPASPEIFIDVADYQHVQDGPLTVLVGHDADYWLDATDRRVGLLYNHRQPMEGSNAQKLQRTFVDALSAARRLEREAELGGRIRFRTDEFLFLINDRGLAPNTGQTYTGLKPDMEEWAAGIFGKNSFSLDHQSQPQKRFSVKITSLHKNPLDSLLKKLGA